jgi:hypothetical protein
MRLLWKKYDSKFDPIIAAKIDALSWRNLHAHFDWAEQRVDDLGASLHTDYYDRYRSYDSGETIPIAFKALSIHFP